MQKKFVIIDNDVLLNDLIEEQVSIVFEKNFNIKFLKTYNINSLNLLDTIDLIIVNLKLKKSIYVEIIYFYHFSYLCLEYNSSWVFDDC